MKPVITVEPSWINRRKKRTCCETAKFMVVLMDSKQVGNGNGEVRRVCAWEGRDTG
jgi:hypothetical protein